MTREDIAKAAVGFANDKCQKRGCSKAYRLHFDFDRYDIEKSFEIGAEWRINSVWHDANEEPKYDEFFLYKNVIQAFHVDCIFPSQDEAFVWDDYVKDWGLMRWAYIKDLIPNKEE